MTDVIDIALEQMEFAIKENSVKPQYHDDLKKARYLLVGAQLEYEAKCDNKTINDVMPMVGLAVMITGMLDPDLTIKQKYIKRINKWIENGRKILEKDFDPIF